MGGRLHQCLGLAVQRVQLGVRKLAEPRFGPVLRRLVGVGLVAGFVAMIVSFWHPVYRLTGSLQIDARNEARALAVVREQPVAFADGGYDGQYYAQLACDPSLRSPELRTAIDTLPYRARRILLPAVAWGLGLGRPERAIQIYSWLNIVCWFGLAALLWPLLQAGRGWRGLVAWAGVMFSAGALTSVRYALTDLPALLLFVLAMRAAQAGRPGRAAGWFGASLLTRETMLVGAWGLCPKPCDKPAGLARAAAWIALAALPLALWLAYILWRVGPSGGGVGNFAWPISGFIGRWRESWAGLHSAPDPLLAWARLLATVATTAQLVFLLMRFTPQERWWRAGAGFAVLLLLLGNAVWEGFPGASPRVLLPLLLACNALVVFRGRAAVWLLLLNLSVPAGLLEMMPQADVQVLAAERGRAGAAVLRADAGCYGPEHVKASCWVWTAQEAQWRLRFWPDAGETQAIVSARVRALDERELVISWAGGELWRGRVGKGWTPVRLRPLPIERGTIVLTLHSDRPAVREGPNADARLFSVCLLNPKIEWRPLPSPGAVEAK